MQKVSALKPNQIFNTNLQLCANLFVEASLMKLNITKNSKHVTQERDYLFTQLTSHITKPTYDMITCNRGSVKVQEVTDETNSFM